VIDYCTFLTDYRVFKKGLRINFVPGINLLVGDQGCGKSSLLGLIMKIAKEGLDSDARKIVKLSVTKSDFMAFDFEKDNPRIKGTFEHAFQIVSRFASHGEVANLMINEISKAKAAVIAMDEPDASLSPRSCYALYDLMKDTVRRGCQIVASVHNPILIASAPEVFSLEHLKWMEGAAFLETQKSPPVNFPVKLEQKGKSNERKSHRPNV